MARNRASAVMRLPPSELSASASVESEVRFEPEATVWNALLDDARSAKPQTKFLGRSAHAWRELTRCELGIPTDRAVLAAGHEAVLWHPGVLAKYFALRAWAQRRGAAWVHLVVDQHTGGFGAFDVPTIDMTGALAITSISLGQVQDDVPMGWHATLNPPDVRPDLKPALPSVGAGIQRIVDLVRAHRSEPNAAAQFSRVLDELLSPWMKPLPSVTASALMTTTLAREFVRAMVNHPASAVHHYNQAVSQVPEAGIGPLNTEVDDVELPFWRIDAQGKRQRAFINDAKAWLDDPASVILSPRALAMTALFRLGASDIFIHGFGGAAYEPAMERWVQAWLGVAPQPMVMVSATLRLPLAPPDEEALDEFAESQRVRHLWHDPSSLVRHGTPSAMKSRMMKHINEAPRRSIERRQLYVAMHEQLAALREEHADALRDAEARLERARAQRRERDIVNRRTWPFSLYPSEMIDALANNVMQHVQTACGSA